VHYTVTIHKALATLLLLLLGVFIMLLLGVSYYFERTFPAHVKAYFVQHSDQVLQDFSTRVAPSSRFPFFCFRILHFAVVDTTGGQVQPVLRVQKADIQPDWRAFLQGRPGARRVLLHGLDLWQRVDSTGRKITVQFKPTEQVEAPSAGPARLSFRDVSIHQATITFENAYKGNRLAILIDRAKLRGSLDQDTLALQGLLDGSIQHLVSKGKTIYRNEPIKVRANYAYATQAQTGLISNTTIEVNHHPVQVTGSHFKMVGQTGTEVDIVFQGTQPLEEVLHDVLPDTLKASFASVEGSGNIAFTYRVSGTSTPTLSPRARLAFVLENGELWRPHRQARLKAITLAGELDTGESQDPESSMLSLSQFSAHTGTGEFHLSLQLANFREPRIRGQLSCDSGLQELADLLDLPHYETFAGRIKLDLHAAGDVNYLAEQRSEKELSWKGNLELQEGAFRPANSTTLLSGLKAEAEFSEIDFKLSRLTGAINGEPFRLQASFRNLLRYAFGASPTITIDGALHAKQFDLAWLAKPAEPDSSTSLLAGNSLFSSTSGKLAVHVEQVQFAPGEQFSGFNMEVHKNKKAVELKKIRFKTPMGGTATGNGGLTLDKGLVKAPYINMDLAFEQLDLQNLMRLIADLGASKQKIALANQPAVSGPTALDDLRVTLKVAARKLQYQHLTGSNCRLSASLHQNQVQIKQFDFESFGGRFTSRGLMGLGENEGFPVQLHAQVQGMNLYRIFYVADQMGLDVLHSSNIRGNIDGGLDLRTRLNQAYLPNMLSTTAYVKAAIRNLELIEVEPIQKALHFLREKRTRHLYFRDVHTRFVLHQNRLITPGINLTNNISYFHLSGAYTMEKDADLYFDVNLLEVLFGNNDRRVRKIQDDPSPRKQTQVKQHLFVYREKGKYEVKLNPRKDNDEARQKLKEEFQHLLLHQKIDTSFTALSDYPPAAQPLLLGQKP
jgi:hypothetical protein